MRNEQYSSDQQSAAEALGDRLVAKIDACETRITARIDRMENHVIFIQEMRDFRMALADINKELHRQSNMLFVNLILTLLIALKVWWP